ncbi:MAG TPA: adenylyltransferase/cytidyltransferase family protein [Coriobacteriia bacterium]|jgi:cytidyltransferase-like protein
MQVTYEELSRYAGRVAMVDGCFDPLHAGHVAYFSSAAALEYPLLANVQSDAYIRSAKGRPNLLPEEERAALIDALADVSYVHLCRTSTADVLRRLRPAVYVKGSDWRGLLPPEQHSLAEELGFRIAFLDTRGSSSSELVSRFLARSESDPAPPSAELPLPPKRRPYAAVVTTHTNPYLSGVAKFSALLARRLGVPCIPLAEAPKLLHGPLLLSVKLSDDGPSAASRTAAALRALEHAGVAFDVFLHAYGSAPEELSLAEAARRRFAGNAEISRRLAADGLPAEPLWCPELLDHARPVGEHVLQLFSFGMAHKVRVGGYERLRDLLEGADVDYSVTVSTAFHEKASFGEIDAIAAGFARIFGDRVSLLGFLSDAAVGHFLRRAHAFVAFFPGGVRSNNTSVLAAMAAGRVPLTNLDADSPQWMCHGTNVLDIARTSAEELRPASLLRLGGQSREDAAANAGWEALVERFVALREQEPVVVSAPW